MSLAGFFESPQNRTGIAIWIGTALTALIQQFVLHQAVPAADLLGLVIGFLKIVEPETTVTIGQMEGAVADMKALITTQSAAALSSVVADAGGLIKAVEA